MRKAFRPRWAIVATGMAMLLVVAAACTREVEVPGETVVVEKEVVKTVEVPGQTVTKEVVKTVQVPGETVVVEKEVVKTVEVPVPGETVIKEVIKTVEVPGETVVVKEQVVKEVVVVATPVMAMEKEAPPTRATSLILSSWGDHIAVTDNFNPYIPGGLSSLVYGVHQGMIESLFYQNLATGEVPAWQAEGFDFSPDFKEFTIKLRDGVKWSDGRPFSAEDMVFTINMLQDNAPTLQYSGDVRERVSSAWVVDAQTVKFSLNEPNPRYVLDQWSSVFSSVYVVPKHIWEGKDPLTFTNFDQDKGWPIFTGPYRFERGSTTEMNWARRPDWWAIETGFKTLPAPQRLTVVPTGGEDTTSALLISNQIDYTVNLGRGALETVMARNPKIIGYTDETGGGRGYGAYSWIDPCPRFIGFNAMAEPFDNPDIRWAINHAIKKDEVIATAFEGATWSSWHLLPEYKGYLSLVMANEDLLDTYPVDEFNLQKTEQLMTKSGYTKDSGGILVKRWQAIELRDPELREFAKPAPLITQNLRDAGFEADFKYPQGAAYADLLATGRAEVFTNIACAFQDPHRMFDQFHKRFAVPIGERAGGIGHRAEQSTRWANDEYSRIVDEMGRTFPGDSKMDGLVRSGLEILMEELPVIPMFQAFHIFAANTEYWQNWPTLENAYDAPAWWLASTIQWLARLEPAQ